MQPISPVLGEEFTDQEVVYAKDQPEYKPLPSLRNKDGVVLTRWKLTDAERESLINGGELFLSIWTFNQPLQPILLEILGCECNAVGIATRMGLI